MYPNSAIVSPPGPGSEPEKVRPDGIALWEDDPARHAGGAFDLRRGALFLRRNLARILGTALLITLCGLGASVLYFNKYVATALILVDPRDAKVTQSPEVL